MSLGHKSSTRRIKFEIPQTIKALDYQYARQPYHQIQSLTAVINGTTQLSWFLKEIVESRMNILQPHKAYLWYYLSDVYLKITFSYTKALNLWVIMGKVS